MSTLVLEDYEKIKERLVECLMISGDSETKDLLFRVKGRIAELQKNRENSWGKHLPHP